MVHHYPLLQVSPEGLSGPLAGAMGEEARKYATLLGALGWVSGLSPSGSVEVLGITCSVDDDGVFHAEPAGLLGSKVGRKITSGVEQAINRKGIRSRSGNRRNACGRVCGFAGGSSGE